MSVKPVIGVVPLWDDEKNSLWMLPGYMDGISEAGGLPVMLPLTADGETLSQACGLCGGFLLTGGHDVSPSVYGSEPSADCGIVCPKRDAMEKIVLKYALERDLPVLGICRGIQFLNAALGGTLYQHLPKEHPSDTEHHQTPPYDVPAHTVAIRGGTPLGGLLGVPKLAVNSYHHQAVKRLAPGLEEMAVSEDGLTEAVWMPGKRFVWGVQWHPEFSYKSDPAARAIFEAFVRAAGQSF